MASLTTALQAATSGMNVSQLGLSTISHNLANANTDGYSRQSVQFSAVSYNGFGAGVQLESVTRYADQYLSDRAYEYRADYGYNSTASKYLSSLESLFTASNSDASLDTQLTSFFTNLSELANTPNSDAQRTIVMQTATQLTNTFNNISNELVSLSNTIDNTIDEEISNINNILKNIDNLNKEIAAQKLSGVNGANANDLEDERQRQVDLLAERFDINVISSTSNGSLRITTENGRTLLHESGYVQLERTSGTPYSGIGFRSVQSNGELSSTIISINTNTLTTGSIKGLVDARDDVVADMKAELDTLANTIIQEVNNLHSQGTSVPAQRTLTSGNTTDVTSTLSDLYTELSPDLAGDTFHISVVDNSGNTIRTTLGNGGAITLPAGGPFSLTDLQDLINNNADVGVTALGAGLGVTATATTDSDGNPVISIQATNSSYKIVLSNASTSDTDNPLGVLGMNNFFTGSTAADMDIRSDIQSDSNLIATARMRTSDGGLSSLDNQNILALADLANTDISFSASGNLGAQSDTISGYAVRINADLALRTSTSESKESFSATVLEEIKGEIASYSGVNMDEELAQMLVYQSAFQASARIISTIDELLNALMQTL